jgi:hypothetical protein
LKRKKEIAIETDTEWWAPTEIESRYNNNSGHQHQHQHLQHHHLHYHISKVLDTSSHSNGQEKEELEEHVEETNGSAYD